jgi:hypothetical protein
MYICEGKLPYVCGSIRQIQDTIGSCFDSILSAFCKVLVFMVRVTMLSLNSQSMQHVVSALAQTQISLSIAPCTQMLINMFSVHKLSNTEMSINKKLGGGKTLSTAVVSRKTVSITTSSLQRLALQAGKRELQCWFNVSKTRRGANCDITAFYCQCFLLIGSHLAPFIS